MKKLLLIFALAAGAAQLRAQVAYTTIVGSALEDAGGNALNNGYITFTPVDANGAPLAAAGVFSRTVRCAVSVGAIGTQASGNPCKVADAIAANPKLCYSIGLYDLVAKATVPTPGQMCAQPTGSSWSYDTYAPAAGSGIPDTGGTIVGPTTFDSSVLFAGYGPYTFGSATSGTGCITFNDNAWDHSVELCAPNTLSGSYLPVLPASNNTLAVAVAGDGGFISSTPAVANSAGVSTLALNTESANCVEAGPGSGSAAVPTCRPLVSADIPNNAANTSGNAANVTGTVAKANGGTGGNTSSIDANCLSATAVQYGCTVFDSGNLNYTWVSGSGPGQVVATMTGTPAAAVYEFCGTVWTSTVASGGNWVLVSHTYPGSFFNSGAQTSTTILSGSATSANKEYSACQQVQSDGTHTMAYDLQASSITGSPGIIHYRFTIRRIN